MIFSCRLKPRDGAVWLAGADWNRLRTEQNIPRDNAITAIRFPVSRSRASHSPWRAAQRLRHVIVIGLMIIIDNQTHIGLTEPAQNEN